MGTRRMAQGLFVLCCLLGAVDGQVAVQPRRKPSAPAEPKAKATLRVDSNLVLVPVSVCDPTNRPVTGLERVYGLIEHKKDRLGADCGLQFPK